MKKSEQLISRNKNCTQKMYCILFSLHKVPAKQSVKKVDMSNWP